MAEPEVQRGGDIDLDDQFDLLVCEVSANLEAGRPVDLEALAEAHPQHIARLRQLLPTLQAMADLGLSVTDPKHALPRQPAGPALTSGVLGDFRILREIGRGGMGVVYEAEQISLGRRVALKVLPFAAVLDPRHLQRFKNEAQAAAALEHPNIVNVYAVGCERGVHYYAMQYIDGQTLAQVIQQLRETNGAPKTEATLAPTTPFAPEPRTLNPEPSCPNPAGPTRPGSEPSPLAPDTKPEPQAGISTQRSHRTPEFFRSVANLGIQAAEALEHAHQMGVVHRDIKPSNLMIDARGHLWITDFGLAQISAPSPLGGEGRGSRSLLPLGEGRGEGASLTMTGDILGTLRYMSPEQAAGKSRVLDHHTDIYSLGVTLYELVTLQPAFGGEDRQKLLREILDEETVRPRQANSAIPRDLETILLKATAKEPQARYPTAQQLADDLRRLLDDKPIRAKRPSLVERAAKWSRRHKPVVWSTAVLLLTAVIATVVVAWNRYQKVLQIEQHLTAAGAFLQAGDYVAADRELAEARGRLDAVLYPSGGLAADLAGLTGQVSGKKEAEERFQRFQEYRQSVHANMYNATPNTMDRVQENCRAALALYRVFDSDRLEGQEGFELLSPQRRAMLKEAVAELLFAWAEMEAAREQEPRDLPESHRRIIAALERIERFYRPIPAVYLWIAQSRRAIGEADAARQAEKQAAAHPPASGLDYFILGEFHYLCEDQPEKSLADYSLALRRQPDHYLSLLAAGLTLWERNRPEETVAMLTGAIAVNPRTTIAYIWRGNQCVNLRQFDLAQADYDAAVEIDPRDYHAYWALAQLRLWQHDDAAALAMYDKAVALAPTTPQGVLLERGQFHVKLGNREKALADYSRVIEWLRPRLGLARSIQRYRGAMSNNPRATYIQACNERSQIYKQLGQPDKAADDLKEALRPAPKSFDSYHARGVVEEGQGEFDKAIADFTEAIRLDPLSPGHYGRRAEAYLKKNDFGRAIADWTEAIRLNPLRPGHYGSRGEAYLKKNDFDRAIADWTEAIRLNPKDGVAYNSRAFVRFRQGDFDKALADLNEAIRLDPKNAPLYSNRSVVYSHKGDFDKALADDNEAIRLDPKNAPAYSNRGAAYCHKGDFDKALADFNEAIRLDPKQSSPYSRRGEAYFRKREFERAIADLTEAIRLNPEDKVAYHFRAWARSQQGDPEQAIADYSVAIRLDPNFSPSYVNRSCDLREIGDLDKAIADLNEAVRLAPEQSAPRRWRADVLERRGDWPAALADYNEAIRLEPKKAHWYRIRAKAFERRGDWPAAVADYNEAIRLEPQSATHYHGRAGAQAALGQIDAARRDLSNAVEIITSNRSEPTADKWERAERVRGLARFLASCADARLRRPDEALRFAEQAIQGDPRSAACWGTLGIARYRVGKYGPATEALEKSLSFSGTRPEPVCWLFLAMAKWQSGEKDKARPWYEKAAQWLDTKGTNDLELLRFRAEAAELLGIPLKPPAEKEKPRGKDEG